MSTYRTVCLHTSTVYDALGGITDEEVRVHLEHTDTHRCFAVVFGRSATSPIPNRIHVRDLHDFNDFNDLEGKEASAAISAALLAIRNHHGNITNPVTLLDCPRCEGQRDLGDVEGGRPCPLCKGHGTCSPDDATDWIDVVLEAATASWGTTREDVPA